MIHYLILSFLINNYNYSIEELYEIDEILNEIIDETTQNNIVDDDKNIEKEKAPSWDKVGGLFDAKK